MKRHILLGNQVSVIDWVDSHFLIFSLVSFRIIARDYYGNLQDRGGDPFRVTITGGAEDDVLRLIFHNFRYFLGSKPVADVKDLNNGTYVYC
jgi:hypothetical protein